jgi:iojap-like protein
MTQPSGQTLLDCITESIRDRKGRAITHVDLSSINSTPAANFIICEGSSTTQVSAIADNIREQLLERQGIKPYGYDGYETSQWIVIDYGDTLVHVFQPATRRLYNLEELWSDAKITNLPDLD